MWYINTYSNIIVYQKYIGTSIKVDCATRVQVQGLKESRIKIREDGDQDPVASEEI